MRNKIINMWVSMKPRHKKILVVVLSGAVVFIIAGLAYTAIARRQAAQVAVAPRPAIKPVSMDNKMLEHSQLLDAKKDAQVAKEELEAFKKNEEDLKKAAALGLISPAQAAQSVPPPVPQQQASSQKTPIIPTSLPPVPQRPLPPTDQRYPPPHPSSQTNQPISVDKQIGGILLVSNEKKELPKDADKKKDETTTVFLPPSFMEATLLSGLDAPTTADAKGNPVPAFIRIKTPAVLPNEVRANLQGCFVIADGKGNLGTERAEMVLVSLSCIDKKGNAVINQKITGIVNDSDNKAGLRGIVVSKMGSMIARSVLAGFMGGVGDALKASSTTTSLSPLGSTSTIDPKDIGIAGAGAGLSSGFKEVQKFYMELAHQTLPVIEIGAPRRVIVSITVGTNLEIKKIRSGGNR